MEEAKTQDQVVLCSLMIDEMAIKKHIEWDGKRFLRYVDIGANIDDDSTPVASEALVFMVVALNGSWKVPCAYFLLKGMSGVEWANLIRQCLMKTHDVGVEVVSLTCDGPSCHFSMMADLGASLAPPNITPHFPHPADHSIKVYVLLDVCHMLKLARNTLAHGGILEDDKKDTIRWSFFKELYDLQENEGLHLGNKLKTAHIMWNNQKMKVNLAAQTLSSSVADALELCANDLKLTQFQGCDATLRFIRIVDHLFDVLNSRNPIAKGYKAPLRPSNEPIWAPFLDEVYLYISKLTDANGQTMTSTKRTTLFIGFMTAILSVSAMYKELVSSKEGPLKYLLTYKLSQDHLELFFGAVRSAGGCNNNPTVRQFVAAYKRLLMRHQIKGANGNCAALDDTNILYTIRVYTVINENNTDTLDISMARRIRPGPPCVTRR